MKKLMGEQVTNREINEILKDVDLNGDGQVDFEGKREIWKYLSFIIYVLFLHTFVLPLQSLCEWCLGDVTSGGPAFGLKKQQHYTAVNFIFIYWNYIFILILNINIYKVKYLWSAEKQTHLILCFLMYFMYICMCLFLECKTIFIKKTPKVFLIKQDIQKLFMIYVVTHPQK